MLRHYLLLLIPFFVMGIPAQALSNDSLDDLLVEVGEQYAKAYIAPLVHGWGANQNSGLFHTATIPKSGLTIWIGLKFMGTYLNEKDQTFRRVLTGKKLNAFLDLPEDHPYYDAEGDIVLQGPTVVGDSDDRAEGRAIGYVNGVPVYEMSTIAGLVQTRWIPLAAPELQIGSIAGLRASVRWLPSIDMGDFGKTSYFGYGLQWNPGFFLPPLPVEVMIGFFAQSIDLGTIVKTDATSVFIAVSKDFALATVYGGLAKESSTFKVNYTEKDSDVEVDFEMEGDMSTRLTLGSTLNLGPVKLNAEMGVGKMTVYTAGLLFGF